MRLWLRLVNRNVELVKMTAIPQVRKVQPYEDRFRACPWISTLGGGRVWNMSCIVHSLGRSMIQVISMNVFESLGECAQSIRYVQKGAEAPADLDKPTCTPSLKSAHDEVISIH